MRWRQKAIHLCSNDALFIFIVRSKILLDAAELESKGIRVPVSKRDFFFFFEGATSYPAFVYLCLPSEAHRATSISDFNISIASSRRLYRDHKNCNCHGQRINFKRNLGVVIGLLKTKCPDMSAPRRNNLQRIEQIQIAYGVHVEQTIVWCRDVDDAPSNWIYVFVFAVGMFLHLNVHPPKQDK